MLFGAIGVALLLGGVYQLLVDQERTHPIYLVLFVVGMAVLDDLVLIPLVLLVGSIPARILPTRAVAPTQAALIVFGGAFFVGLVFALSPARDGEAGTLLTAPYGRNLLLIAGVIAMVAAACCCCAVFAIQACDVTVVDGDAPRRLGAFARRGRPWGRRALSALAAVPIVSYLWIAVSRLTLSLRPGVARGRVGRTGAPGGSTGRACTSHRRSTSPRGRTRRCTSGSRRASPG